jgi:hypothetical protein
MVVSQSLNLQWKLVHYTGAQDWAGTKRYLLIRAFQNGQGSGRLHMGPSIPIYNKTLPDADIERIAAANLEALAL